MRFSECCALIPEGCPLEYYSGRFELQKNTGQTKKAQSVHFDPHAPRLVSAVYAMALCEAVCVCLSRVGVRLKQLNTGSHKQNHTIVQGI